MISTNLYQRLATLLPQDPLRVGQVVSLNADGTSTVLLPDGGLLRPRGQGVSIGSNAFVKSGQIQGLAPDLTVVEIEI
jgi:hypothetical protein